MSNVPAVPRRMSADASSRHAYHTSLLTTAASLRVALELLESGSSLYRYLNEGGGGGDSLWSSEGKGGSVVRTHLGAIQLVVDEGGVKQGVAG